MTEPDGTNTYRTVRLRPNRGKAFLGGHPWVYADEVVMDRRTGALEPGSVVRVQDAKRQDVGLAAINGASSICLRELDRDPSATIDASWIRGRLARALALREALYSHPFYRLCNGEGDGLPGLVVDRFGGALVVQPNTAWSERALEPIVDALVELTSAECVIANRDSRGRVQEQLDAGRETLRGAAPGIVEVQGPVATLLADLEAGQKTGAFFDQFPNHHFAARLALGKRVLDVFSHTGGFALSALAAGAREAVAVDSSEHALDLANRAAVANGVAGKFRTERGDALNAMRALASDGERFGLVICDPPAFAPRKSALEAGLRAYERVAARAIPIVEPGGILIVCSCSHAVGPDALHAACARAFHRASRRTRLIHAGGAGPDHPVHPALPVHGYLKVMVYALD